MRRRGRESVYACVCLGGWGVELVLRTAVLFVGTALTAVDFVRSLDDNRNDY